MRINAVEALVLWMKRNGVRRARIVVGFLVVVTAVSVSVMLIVRMSGNWPRRTLVWSKSSSPQNQPAAVVSPPPPPPTSVAPNANSPLPASSRSPTFTVSPAPQIPEGTEENNLIIPVAGVRPDELRDTYAESRSEGRVHDAIDIVAPLHTPVLATADGTIVKLFHSERGGTTIYQLSVDNKLVYYYAHLDRYVEGLTEGHFAKQGELIAYVGDTGNAGAGNYHLHFSISLVSDPKHYWQGVNINPYPLLKR